MNPGVTSPGPHCAASKRDVATSDWKNALVTKWVRSFWDEEDVTFFWEVRDDGWIARSVEHIGRRDEFQAAAALDEVIRARDTGGAPAVVAYEERFGVAPETPIENWDFRHEDISEIDFERVWVQARQALQNR